MLTSTVAEAWRLVMPAAAVASAKEESLTVPVLIMISAALGIFTIGYLLYRTYLRREVDILEMTGAASQLSDPQREALLRQKLSRLSVPGLSSEEALDKISRVVREEADERLRSVRQELTLKVQRLEEEKTHEVETVRKDLTDVKQRFEAVETAYRQVDEQKKTTEAVVKSMAEGLVVVNQKGEVLLMNPSAERILGVKEKKLGRPLSQDLGEEMLISMQSHGPAGEKVIEYQSKNDSTKKILRQSSAVIQNENGQTIGMVNILTDVTKQRELDEMKNKFVSNVTHELRTPIVAMQKAIAILLNQSAGTLSETQMGFLTIISRNLSHLSRLVEDVLDVAKIDSGNMKFNVSLNRLDKVIEDVCETFDTWANSKDIRILREFDRSIPELVFDRDKVRQVLINLIGNAIKFTPAGGFITVRASWSEDRQSVRVSVADSGIGISKENMAHLFGRFEQFGDHQGISGTGLGLNIARELVERHGGRIWAESEEKKGSTFMFTLPIKSPLTQGGV
ncbi:MAG: Adaptive-response sensory-kinase SasA [Candidatus Omnitrophica bacterium]|nr:Adaptive-response sensory-kinase SasA [Candidatus Omnitrophota bacterium]